MNKHFYTDMAQRAYSISLFGELFVLLRSKAQTLTHYGFTKIEDQIMLVFLLLRIIMEKTLKDEYCTIDDMALELMEMNGDIFHLPLDYSQCKSLALLIVDHILSNSGEPIEFQAFYKAELFPSIFINYLTTIVFDGNKVSYRMSDDGFHLMLSTLEMEQNMQLQFRDMIFQMQLKKRNYSKALDEIRHIFDILKMKELEFKDQTARIKKNAEDLNSQQYKEMIDENFEVMDESRERFSTYQEHVKEQIEKIGQSMQESTIDPSQIENLRTLDQISSLLHRSLTTLANILNSLMNFSTVFTQELNLQLQASSRQRYSFSSLVLEPVLKQADLLSKIDHYLHPLFMRQPSPQFQLDHAFEYRRIIVREEKDFQLEIDDEYDERLMERLKQERRQQKDDLNHSLFLVLQELLKTSDKTVTLAELGQLEGLLPNVRHAKVLLSSWINTQHFSLDALKKERKELVFDEEVPYSFSLSLLEMLSLLPELQQYKEIVLSKEKGKVFYHLQEDGLNIKIEMDNLRFSLK